MQETKTTWTPGPWNRELRGQAGFYIGIPERLVAGIQGTDAEAAANSHLIQAAPELYEALEAALQVFDELAEIGRINGAVTVRSWLDHSATAHQLQDALKKARGE